MKAKQFDETFDRGGNVTHFLDHSKARRPEEEQKRVNVDFPAWMVKGLDREAVKLNVSRQAVIKMWIHEHLR